ncbi:MAG TPA: hypothetical protein VEA99_19045 [Gemmatimonadaceae bacterium]|nr:hypothetical protein [Gemmatimonadaceae bacterium]
MPDTITTLFVGAVGGAVAAAIQYGFRRLAEAEQVRREIVERQLLQLQDAVESLYYRANNLRDWAGKAVMSEVYYRQTSAYAIGRVLAHASLLVSTGVYAKLRRDALLKHEIKARLHALDRAMDDQSFLHYHRVQLGEMALDGERVLGYTAFLARWPEARFADATESVSRFLQAVAPERLDAMRREAERLIALLSRQTSVPSALALAGEGTQQ